MSYYFVIEYRFFINEYCTASSYINYRVQVLFKTNTLLEIVIGPCYLNNRAGLPGDVIRRALDGARSSDARGYHVVTNSTQQELLLPWFIMTIDTINFDICHNCFHVLSGQQDNKYLIKNNHPYLPQIKACWHNASDEPELHEPP